VEVENVRSVLVDEFDSPVEVKTFGTSNQVRITTAYMIQDNSDQANAQVDDKLAAGLKKVNPQYEIMDSQKVTPTIADDIKTSAIYAVIFSILVIFLYVLIRFRRMAFGFAAIVALVHDVLVL